MALHIVTTEGRGLVGPDACGALEAGCRRGDGALLLVGSRARIQQAQKALAAHAGLGLGVAVSTPQDWADERWEVWGDGRRPIGARARRALMRLELDAACDRQREGAKDGAPASLAGDPALLPDSAGMLETLCDVARDALPLIPKAPSGGFDAEASEAMGLTAGERRACSVICAYGRRIHEQGLIERAEVLDQLPALLEGRGAALPDIAYCGFDEMGAGVRRMLARLATRCEVTVELAGDGGPAAGLARSLGAGLERAAREAGCACDRRDGRAGADGPVPDPACDPELAALSRALFRPDAPKVAATGAVARLEPAGPLAEAELVAREAAALAAAGAREIVITAGDVPRAWHDLAPKLAARGLLCRCALRRPVMDVPAARAFAGYVDAIAKLAELDGSWPEPEPSEDGPVPRLGDMGWWPPRGLTDFLLSDLSCMDAAWARGLDARWRGNRMLSPAGVLRDLGSARWAPPSVREATALVLKGRVGTAARKLAEPLLDPAAAPMTQPVEGARKKDPEPPAAPEPRAADPVRRKEALDILALVQGVCAGFGELGISASQGGEDDGGPTVTLAQLSGLLQEALARESLLERLELGPADAACAVRICSRPEAASLEARSADALIACGLTSAEYDLSRKDDAAGALAERLGLDAEPDPLPRARRDFAAAARVPRSRLVLERAANGSDGKETYPAVVLSDCLAAYGVTADAKPEDVPGPLRPRVLGEDLLVEDASASGKAAAREGSQIPAPGGSISARSQAMIVVPQEGRTLDDGLPSLSATQIESYLECPLKWFAQRRLGLGGIDAEFKPVQAGDVAHHVLERSRGAMALAAAQRAGLLGPDATMGDLQRLSEPACIPGAAVTPETLEEARRLVADEFDRELRHQRRRGVKLSSHAYVPHDETERLQVGWLKDSLLSETDFEGGRLEGFEPRWFEFHFGGRNDAVGHAEYAGVELNGSVDRIDVNPHGVAVIIDYKNKPKGSGPSSFASEYDAFPAGVPADKAAFSLPRHVQALMYAQVIRRARPDLKVRGALYLSTRGGARGEHELAGALDGNFADQVLGAAPGAARASRLLCGGSGAISFEEALDACEERVAEAVPHLLAGEIPARPIDAGACRWCPVHDCEKRLS